jgi:hypothetical protein
MSRSRRAVAGPIAGPRSRPFAGLRARRGAWRRVRQGARLAARWALLVLVLAALPAARATPGTAYVVLQPCAGAGQFDAASWIANPAAWPTQCAGHPDGWSVAYRALDPPPGWERPFVLRGGGPGAGPGGLNPRFACALAQMLPSRASAMVAFLDAPDSAACSPGKPNPFPLCRDGWLFLHDGYIGIESMTRSLWLGNLGPGWEAFKLDHPRDYDGNRVATRGSAGEIYFLALLQELGVQPEDVPRAFGLTLARMAGLAGAETWQANAILQRPGCTWALRYAWADEERYPIYYGLTVAGEYCITDSLPAGGGPWVEIPNQCLAILPATGEPSIVALEFSGLGEPARPEIGVTPAGAARQPRLSFARAPSCGSVRLSFEVPAGAGGKLELFDPQGRLLARVALPQGRGDWTWDPPPDARGVVFGLLTCSQGKACARTLMLR